MADNIEKEKIKKIFELNEEFIQQKDLSIVYKELINTIQHFCKCDAGFLFTIDEDFLSLKYCNIQSKNFEKMGTNAEAILPTTFIPTAKKKRLKTPAELCAINNEIINIDTTLSANDWDTTNFNAIEEMLEYNIASLFCVPIISRDQKVVAVIELINAKEEKDRSTSFNIKDAQVIAQLCTTLALLLEARQAEKHNSLLLESFIDVLSKALDRKSHYTAIHCQRVPIITRMLTSALAADDGPVFKDFNLSEDDWYTIHIASWLHDCGKVTTPDYILEKATKLETVYNRIHEIRNRFEILRRDAHIEYLKSRLINKEEKEILQEKFIKQVKQLEADFSHVAKCNIGDTPLSDNDINKLNEISQKTFTRYFSRIKGLSWSELNTIENKDLFDNPAEEHLIQNRKDQKYNEFNLGEIYNLGIKAGTINKEERERINEHITVTIDMLSSIPFPKRLEKIAEYAGGHHERMDGKGYPFGVKAGELPIPARIMAIADVFEALTSVDRPYKKPKKLSTVLEIMQDMKNTGHIDPDIYEVFIKSKTYLEYAKQYLSQEQIDEFNEEVYL